MLVFNIVHKMQKNAAPVIVGSNYEIRSNETFMLNASDGNQSRILKRPLRVTFQKTYQKS